MKEGTKQIVTLGGGIIGAVIGSEMGKMIGRANLGTLGSIIGFIIGTGIGSVSGSLVANIIVNVLFPTKILETLPFRNRIVDNKLYYNINCNGKVAPLFITAVDEYIGKYKITNKYTNYFPIVMVNGEIKIFILENIIRDEGYYNFYTVKEINITEVSLEEEKVLIENSRIISDLDYRNRIKLSILRHSFLHASIK